MNILYITFGDNLNNHLQAAFSICSFLSGDKKPASITVYTDAPGFYNHLKNEVTVCVLSPEQLTDWKGPYHFFWRIKIKAIELFAGQHAGQPIMYLDTDTLLYNDVSVLCTQLAAGTALMHQDEGRLSEINAKTTRQMWKAVQNKKFGGILLDDRHHMWNAGVVASPNNKGGEEFRLALNLCDELCAADIRRRLLEQFSLSVALETVYGLKSAEGSIAHYWSTKEEWHGFLTQFFLTAFFHASSTEQLIENFRLLDHSLIPISKEVKTTSLKLQKLANKLFKKLFQKEKSVYLKRQGP